MTIRQIEIVTRTLVKYGFFNGLLILIRLYQCKTQKTSLNFIDIFIKKLDLRLSLRPGTTDWLVFLEVFVDEIYGIDLASGDIRNIIDAGANAGYTSLYFSRKYPKAQIISIEPESYNFALLERNSAFNKNIKPIYGALVDEDKEVTIVDPNYGDWGFRVGELDDGLPAKNKVPGYSVKSILKEHGIEFIDIFKIDIEGAEKQVFSSDLSFISKTKFIVIELHPEVKGSIESFLLCLSNNPPEYIKGKGENLIVKFNR